MLRRISLAAVVGAAGLAAAFVAFAATVDTSSEEPASPPIYALVTPTTALGPTELAQVDRRTLRPLAAPRLDLGAGAGYPIARSPDGTLVVLQVGRLGPLKIVDLEHMRTLGAVGIAANARATAWLTADRLVVLEQEMRGSYNSIVDKRRIVVVDPLAQKVLSRRAFADERALLASAPAGDRLVLLLGRADLKSANYGIAVVNAAGEIRTADLSLGRSEGRRMPAVAVDPAGERVYVVVPNHPVTVVELDTLEQTSHPVTGAKAVFAPAAEFTARHARFVGDSLIAVSGNNNTRTGKTEIDRGAGVAVLDIETWRARLIGGPASTFSFGDGVLVVHGIGSMRTQGASGKSGARQTFTVPALAAYDLQGRRLWSHPRDFFAGSSSPLPPMLGVQVIRDLVKVQVGPMRTVDTILALRSGRKVAVSPAARGNVFVLDEPVRLAQPSRKPASTATAAQWPSHASGAVVGDEGRVQSMARRSGVDPASVREVVSAGEGRERLTLYAADGAGGLHLATGDARGTGEFHALAATVDRVTAAEGTPPVLVRFSAGGGGNSPGAASWQSVVGLAREDVTRIAAVLADGSEFDLPLNAFGGFGHAGHSPSQPVVKLRAYAAGAPAGAPVAVGAPLGEVTVDPVGPPGAASQGAAPRGYTVSNRGRKVRPNQRRGRLFDDHPYELFLLGVVRDIAFYRVQLTPRYTCWGNGNADRIGDIGSLGCPNLAGAYPLQNEGIVMRMSPQQRQPQYIRINGIAVDQAATIALVDEQGTHVATAPVENNLYSFSPPFPESRARVVALDAQGHALKPHPEWGEHQTPPPNLFGPRATRVKDPKLTAPTQRGEARGVKVEVGSNGVVVVDGTAIEPRARKLVGGRRIGINCFVLSANHRQTRTAGVSAPWQPTIAFVVHGFKPPFDGCELQGSYGHRWRDQYGTHSAVEVALTPRAHRYFANRAAARDLALFVRSRKTQQIRKNIGPDLIAALRREYGSAVVVLTSKNATAPVGAVGVWASGSRTIFSEKSTVGVRFFVELENGKIVKESVRGLAFVF
jgi:hypothetical protein